MFDTHVNLTPLLMVVLTGFLVPFGTYLGHTGLKLAERLLEPYIGQKNALVLQQRRRPARPRDRRSRQAVPSPNCRLRA